MNTRLTTLTWADPPAQWRYLKYVLRHKYWVLRAGLHLGVPLGQLLRHDASKFSWQEWWPYVAWMYDSPDGTTDYWRNRAKEFPHDEEAQLRKRRFQRAWEHHWQHNPHHWEFWSFKAQKPGSTMEPAEMPGDYIREMVADWIGAGYAQGKRDVVGWFLNNERRMDLAPATHDIVVGLMLDEVATFRRRYP